VYNLADGIHMIGFCTGGPCCQTSSSSVGKYVEESGSGLAVQFFENKIPVQMLFRKNAYMFKSSKCKFKGEFWSFGELVGNVPVIGHGFEADPFSGMGACALKTDMRFFFPEMLVECGSPYGLRFRTN